MFRFLRPSVLFFALFATLAAFAIESLPKEAKQDGVTSGYATYYTVKSCQSEGTSGVYTANGETFDENALTCAMRSRDWGKMLRVTNQENHKSVIVRLNDYGPGNGPRRNGVVIDLTPTAWKALGVMEGRGRIQVTVETVKPDATPQDANAEPPPATRIVASRTPKRRRHNEPFIPIDPF